MLDLGWAPNPVRGDLIRERQGRFETQTSREKAL